MKKIIIGLLSRGYTTTTKYTVQDLTRKLYILKYLIKEENGLICCNNNGFWNAENNKNRLDLIHDIKSAKIGKITNGAYYHMLVRMAHGDQYGIT